MRLLFVIKSLASQGGGAERVLCEICSELARRGHSVEVASFDQTQAADFYPLDQNIDRTRLAVGRIEAPTRVVEFHSRTRRLRSLLIARRPDVAIGFMHSAFVPLGLAAAGTGIPVIASEHTSFEHYRMHRLQITLISAAKSLYMAFTTTSERVRRGFPRRIAERMTVIPNPVIFPGSPGRSTDPDGERILLSVGRLRKEKGHATLIAAFARVAGMFPDWRLRIVGDGPCRQTLHEEVAALGIAERVTFAGARADVSPDYASADLFAVPSTYESFGLATAEALAAGVPAIGFAECPGTNELIIDGVNGLLVSGRDRVQALMQGLERLMRSDELRERLGQAGPASVERYSVARIADRWEELLRSVSSTIRKRPWPVEGRYAEE